MRAWLQSIRFRLTLLLTVVNLCVLAVLAMIIYGKMKASMHADLDRELRSDFDVIGSALEFEHGRLEWELHNSPNDTGFNFDALDKSNSVLFTQGQFVDAPIVWPSDAEPVYTTLYGHDAPVRMLSGVITVDRHEVLVRAQRSMGVLEQTLSQIAGILAGTVPLALLLAGVAGYLLAGRFLAPIDAMRQQAASISANSLSERLPISNPNDEIGRLATVFNETFARLENSFDELRRFTADASHELRTPLTALRIVGEVALKEDGDSAAKDEAISSILEEADRLNQLVVALLDLSRGDTGAALELEEVELAELLKSVVDTLELFARERDVRLRIDAAVKPKISSNFQFLRQAVLNVVHNAIRHSPGGQEVLITLASRDNWTRIEVEDRGPGIAPEHHAKVFDRFYRVDPSRTRADGGFGLGLAIAKQSIERLGGEILLESTVGKGARFIIRFPA